MKKRIIPIRLLCSLLAIVLLFGGIPASAFVSDSHVKTLDITAATMLDAELVSEPANHSVKVASEGEIQEFDLSTGEENEILPIASTGEDRESPATFGARALGQLDMGLQPAGNITVPLNQDDTHILIFELKYDTLLFSKMTSENSGYAYQIFSITEDGTLEGYSGAVLAGNSINGIIPAGKYAFVVANAMQESFGESYTLFLNTATPELPGASAYAVMRLTDAYDQITLRYISYLDSDSEHKEPKTTVFVDGVRVIDETSEEDILEWERRLELNWGSGYNSNWHHIFEANVQGISAPGKYTSDYVSSDYAVRLTLGVGTGFTYNESRRNWDTGEHFYTTKDASGMNTPRRLDAYDIKEYKCYLIFDLVTGKPIDFDCLLNKYYWSGAEHRNFEEY